MSAVPVVIEATPTAEDEEIAFLDDVDELSSPEVMLGCGNDNPY